MAGPTTKVPTEPRFHEVELTRRLYRAQIDLLERLEEAKDIVDVVIAAGIARQKLEGIDDEP